MKKLVFLFLPLIPLVSCSGDTETTPVTPQAAGDGGEAPSSGGAVGTDEPIGGHGQAGDPSAAAIGGAGGTPEGSDSGGAAGAPDPAGGAGGSPTEALAACQVPGQTAIDCSAAGVCGFPDTGCGAPYLLGTRDKLGNVIVPDVAAVLDAGASWVLQFGKQTCVRLTANVAVTFNGQAGTCHAACAPAAAETVQVQLAELGWARAEVAVDPLPCP